MTLPSPPASPAWTALLGDHAAEVVDAMRLQGETELHRALLRYLRALALEVGAAVEAGKTPPGLPFGDGRRNLDVPATPVFLSYTVHVAEREIRVADLVWVHTG